MAPTKTYRYHPPLLCRGLPMRPPPMPRDDEEEKAPPPVQPPRVRLVLRCAACGRELHPLDYREGAISLCFNHQVD